MLLIQTLTVAVLGLHCSYGQIFPFSNLRAFFDPKTTQPKDKNNNQLPSGPNTANFSRPYRQANRDGPGIPTLPEFDSPDIFTINRDIGGHKNHVVRQQPSFTSPDLEYVSRPPKRKGTSSRYRIAIQPTETSVFITPKPNDFVFEDTTEDEVIPFTKIKPKTKSRIRKQPTPQVHDLERLVEPFESNNDQSISTKDSITLPFSNSNNKLPEFLPTLPTEEDAFVENFPAVEVPIEENNLEQNDGLVDYLVPPNLPSVYEKNLKSKKSRNPAVSTITKRKPPPLTSSLLKKDPRSRVKKRRNEIKPSSLPSRLPLPDRATTKRQVSRRRPSPTRQRPLRKPLDNNRLTRQEYLQQQAAQMDEQITAETGFTDGSHHSSQQGGERVEFQMHGQKGPQSYKFGYDTGKGHNRQFRFEEKDNHGYVKGHYGYYDKHGKLQVVNYEADPHTGFKADSA